MKYFWSVLGSRRIIYRVILFGGDAVLILLAFRLSFFTRFNLDFFLAHFPVTKGIPTFEVYYSLQAISLVVWMMGFGLVGFYRRVNMTALDELLRVFHGVAAGWIVIVAGTYFYRRTDYSRIVLSLSALYTFGLIYVFREAVKIAYARVATRWWAAQNMLILGNGRLSHSIRAVLNRHPEFSTFHEATKDPEKLRDILRQLSIREVFVGEPDLDHTTLVAMSEVCGELNIPFRIVPDVLELRMGEVIIDNSLGLPTFQVKSVSLHGWTYFYKRTFDVVCSIILLAVGFIPLCLIAVMIKLDTKGPVLYEQSRMGFRRRIFAFYKFRTMIQDADNHLEELKKKSERSGPVFKMKNDPRVTQVGRWLRKFSLDEIPQIINVLKGDMSLVGPRPQVLWEASAYDNWARKRLNVLPGITGLWQVSGRARLSYQEMIDLDVFYIENWSPGLDLKILLRTIPTILHTQGAY